MGLLSSADDPSASTYPASEGSLGQDGDTRVPVLIKAHGVGRGFSIQASGAPFDCQAVSARNCSSFRLPCGATIPRSRRMARGKPHRRAHRRFRDPLGVVIVGILRLGVGPDILGRRARDDGRLSTPPCRRCTKEALRHHDQTLPLHLAPQHDRPGPVETGHAQTFLPRSTPRIEILAKAIPIPPREPPASLRRRKEGRAIP